MSPHKYRPSIFEAFLKVYKTLIWQNNFLGITTLYYNDHCFYKSKLRCILNIASIVLYLPLTIYTGYKDVSSLTNNIFRQTTSVIFIVAYSTYIVIIWFFALINSERMIEFWHKVLEFDEKCCNYGQLHNYKTSSFEFRIKLALRYILVLIISTSMITFDHLQGQEITSSWGLLFFMVMHSITCHLMIMLIFIIQHRFMKINENIKKLVMASKNKIYLIAPKETDTVIVKKEMNIFVLCGLHHHATKLIKAFNEIFGIVMLCMFTVSFIQIVVNFFYITANLQAQKINWGILILNSFFSMPFMWDIYYICTHCYKTIEEVKKSGELIHQIETSDEDVINGIEMFSLQIATAKIEFSAAGFFPVDKTLLFSILGGVTTYIIILIQLSASVFVEQPEQEKT